MLQMGDVVRILPVCSQSEICGHSSEYVGHVGALTHINGDYVCIDDHPFAVSVNCVELVRDKKPLPLPG